MTTQPTIPTAEILNLWLTNNSNATYLSRASRKYKPLIDSLIESPPARVTSSSSSEELQAILILLFHLSRVLYPGTQRKKIYEEIDPIALPLALQTLQLHPTLLLNAPLPQALSILEIPFHSESLSHHIQAFNKLASHISWLEGRYGKESTEVVMAKKFWVHMEDRFDVLKRFQKFPWRDEALGRESSFAEDEFMQRWRSKGGGPKAIAESMAVENDEIVAEWKTKNGI